MRSPRDPCPAATSRRPSAPRNAPYLHDPVAQPRGRFEIQMFGGFGHFLLQMREQRFLFSFQKEDDLIDRAIVILFRLVADARRQAALDMVLQARTFAAPVDRLAAGSQRKDETDEVDQLA